MANPNLSDMILALTDKMNQVIESQAKQGQDLTNLVKDLQNLKTEVHDIRTEVQELQQTVGTVADRVIAETKADSAKLLEETKTNATSETKKIVEDAKSEVKSMLKKWLSGLGIGGGIGIAGLTITAILFIVKVNGFEGDVKNSTTEIKNHSDARINQLRTDILTIRETTHQCTLISHDSILPYMKRLSDDYRWITYINNNPKFSSTQKAQIVNDSLNRYFREQEASKLKNKHKQTGYVKKDGQPPQSFH